MQTANSVNVEPCGFDEDGSEIEHDWETRSDWEGDPEVINGTQTFLYRVCRACGVEDYETPVDPPSPEDDAYGWAE